MQPAYPEAAQSVDAWASAGDARKRYDQAEIPAWSARDSLLAASALSAEPLVRKPAE
jgi:hypothetical protein